MILISMMGKHVYNNTTVMIVMTNGNNNYGRCKNYPQLDISAMEAIITSGRRDCHKYRQTYTVTANKAATPQLSCIIWTKPYFTC